MLVKSPSYQGVRSAKNEGVTFTFYTDYGSAYNDLLADAVDVLDAIPDSALSSFKSELGDRAINQPGAVIQCFAINVNSEHWKMDDEGRARRAERPVAQHRPAPGQHHGERNPVNGEEPIAFTRPLIGVHNDRAQALFDQDFPRPPPQIPQAVGGDASETDQQWRFASLQEVLDVLAERGRRIRAEPLAGDMDMRTPGRVRRVEAGAELINGLR